MEKKKIIITKYIIYCIESKRIAEFSTIIIKINVI